MFTETSSYFPRECKMEKPVQTSLFQEDMVNFFNNPEMSSTQYDRVAKFG